jgi:hypothetical protein
MTKAFGDAASIFRRELAILAKGLFAKKLRDTHDEANLTEILLSRLRDAVWGQG